MLPVWDWVRCPCVSQLLVSFQQSAFATEGWVLNRWGRCSSRGAGAAPLCTAHSCRLQELITPGTAWIGLQAAEQTANLQPAETTQPCSPLCRYSIYEWQFLRLGVLSSLFKAVKTALMHCINLAKGWLEAVRVVCHLSKQHQASKWGKQYKVEILLKHR